MQALRVGVIGAGHFGRFHALKLAKAGVLAGLCDASPARAAAVAAEAGCPALPLDGLIAASDALVVAAPTAHHGSLGLAVLEAGRHLFIEKPIAATLEEADRLIETAAARGLVLQVGHIERYSAAVATLRQAAAGFAPRVIQATRIAPFRPRGLDVSVVLDLMIHDIDLVLSLAGEEPAAIAAVGGRIASALPDYAVAELRFPSGLRAEITASRVAVAMERRLRMLGDGGELRVDFLARSLSALRPGGAEPDPHLPGFGRDALSWADHDSLEAEQAAFLRAIREGVPPEADGRAGRAALAVALAVERALGA
ncbi:MAG: Gfo/Idh/MocA family oxidoreductase [Rhodovarius sp.]|nr:Gfo/Idh/MocA family oxidoreductase [Rhodovarius sp.]MCX7932082.1 Gfo/Idh/MocA family oxidoreductase [Rhodovarius sp.]MDW8314732.1 Gfo/Idh/MocA family oxidoreductase [Rhodovarius sp.]